jgi:hypothetical protein
MSETRGKAERRVLCALVIGEILGALLLGASGFATTRPDHPYRYSVVDMPVSLAVGTVRTPEFPVVSHWYWIMIQVQEPLPAQQMRCMMGVTTGPLDSKDCTSNDPLLQADWTVWDGEQIVARGSIPSRCACRFDHQGIYKILGNFAAKAGKKYVVKVKFTKDGTPLNVANPHLIVIKEGDV